MVPELLLVAIDFNRSPLRYPLLGDPDYRLPPSFGGLLRDFGGALVPPRLERTARRVGLSPADVQEAARFFVRHVLLIPAADHYRVLGVSPDAGADQVREHYHLLVRLFHPDRGATQGSLEALETTRLNVAYHILRDDGRRVTYDAALAAAGGGDQAAHLTLEAFRPNYRAAALFDDRNGAASRRTVVTRLAVGGALGLIIFTFLALLATVLFPARPILRMAPEIGDQPASPPAYLAGRGAQPSVAVGEAVAPGDPIDREGGERHFSSLSTPVQLERREGQRSQGDVPQVVSAAQSSEQLSTTTSGADVAHREGSVVVSASATSPPVSEVGTSDGLDGSSFAAPPTPSHLARADVSHPGAGRDGALQSELGKPGAAPSSDSVTVTSQNVNVIGGEGSLTIPSPAKLGVSRGASVAPQRDEGPPGAPFAASADRVQPALGVGRSVDVASEGRRSDVSSREEAAAPKMTAMATDVSSAAYPAGVIRDFQAAYEVGDPGRLAALFAPDARINEGEGRGLVRELYADLFRRVSERSLTIGPLRWSVTKQGLWVGEGAVLVGSRSYGARRWRRGSGTIRFELTPVGEGYQITKMIYDLGPQ